MNFDDIIAIKNKMVENGCDLRQHTTYTFYRCFSDTAVHLAIWVPKKYEIIITVDLVDHTVYLVDYYNHKDYRNLRWINPEYVSEFTSELFELQQDPLRKINGAPIERTTSDDVLNSIRLDIFTDIAFPDDSLDEYEETIELDLTDSELATIARAAHAKDMTITEFINEALRYELDKVMPEWREEFKS